MENIQKKVQYGYAANAALVLTSERGSRRDFTPASEVTSLAGKKSAQQMMREMGGRATASSSSSSTAAAAAKKRSATTVGDDGADEDAQRKKAKKGLGAGYDGVTNVLNADVEAVYRPATRETRLVYETLLTFLQGQMGDKPSDVLASAADEVIAVLKDDSINAKQQQASIESLFNRSIDVDNFRQLVNIGKKITDFNTGGASTDANMTDAAAAAASSSSASGELDQKLGVAVVFGEGEDGEEEEEQGMGGRDVPDDDDEDEEEEEEEKTDSAASMDVDAPSFKIALGATTMKRETSTEDLDEDDLDARTIDAHWIQRQVATFQSDPHAAQKAATDIFTLLANPTHTDAHCENALVTSILGFEQFGLIKKLLRNRWKIIYSIRLLQAGSDENARRALLNEMESDPKLQSILKNLTKTVHSAADRSSDLEKKLATEAREIEARRTAKKNSEEEEEGRASSSNEKSSDAFWSRRTKALVDLDSLQLEGGSHFMSNGEVKLPKNSEIINKTGYQEVHIPPLKPHPFTENEALIQIKDLPTWAQPAFASTGMIELNRIQSRLYETAMKTPENLLVCAPTGAGKTNVAMLTMLREIGLYQKADGTFDTDAFKIIYVAPMKSLVQEMVNNFSGRLKPFGINVAELSGDQNLNKEQLAQTQVIVVTPEKLDIVTRKAGDRNFMALVKLIIIDEVHLLHDTRGATLEAIVARTIRQIEQTQDLIRLVGLSATLPNYEDVAMFLRVKPDKGLFFFDNSYRPVPLEQQYVGLTAKKAFKRHQQMNEICYEKVVEVAGKKQVLVFVHSRKETATTARALKDQALAADELGKFLKDEATRELLTTMAEGVKSQQLKELLPFGFAIHHAGMTRSDRTLVEELFADSRIQVLVSTATLAWGVNLPGQKEDERENEQICCGLVACYYCQTISHRSSSFSLTLLTFSSLLRPASRVIIKGTQVYDAESGGWKELSMLDIGQMTGRAGRPQFDVLGQAVILTSHKELHYYLSLLNEQLPVESQFIQKLADNLNAEIVLGTVSNVREAVSWLGYTYLYVRMLRKPSLYGISPEQAAADPYLEQRRVDLIHTAATILDRNHLIKYDKKTGSFQVTDLGRVASNYYITHQSLAVFNEYLKPTLSDIELFRVFSLSSEFKNISVREEEKIELAKLIDKVPIPIKESIDEPSAKVNTLLQAYISRLSLDGFALLSDMVYITQSAARIVRALFEIVLKRGWASAALKCLNLAKMIDHRMWSAQSPLRQFEGSRIPQDIIKRIESKDFSWEQLYDLEPPAIGELIRFPKMGTIVYKGQSRRVMRGHDLGECEEIASLNAFSNTFSSLRSLLSSSSSLRSAVHQLPRFEMQGSVQPITRSTLRVELTITPDFQYDATVHGNAEPFWIIVEDVDSEIILHHEYFLLKRKFAQTEHQVSFTIPVFDPLPPQYFVRLVSDRWIGSEIVLPMSFRSLLLPEKFAPPTELLDLQPITTNEIASEKWIGFFEKRFEIFNPIQTQCFSAVYKKSDSVFIAAPTGSGVDAMAELAIIRQLIAKPQGSKIVYIAPLASIAEQKYKQWKASFDAIYGVSVGLLPGETGADLKLLSSCTIIIATPEQWDVLSRRWKTRKPIQDCSLLIVDELQLLAGRTGPVIEIIVSRMRYMTSQLKSHMRIVGLSASIANAKDVGEWLGCSSANIFNFHPASRPIPLEIRVLTSDITDFHARTTSFVKPAYAAMNTLSPNKPVFLFAPNKKYVRSTALDLMTFAIGDDQADRFIPMNTDMTRAELREKLSKKLQNKTLLETLTAGIGFLYENMPVEERTLVETLYRSNYISVIVLEYSLCWGFNLQSHMTIVLGCQQYESSQHRYVDIPINDVTAMIGLTCRPQIDSKSLAVVFCVSSKKETYKRFLYQPAPIESHLESHLADSILAEIVTQRIKKTQDAIDYLTWSFLYRRLTQNPAYYSLAGTTHQHFSDHLSEMVETVIEDLQTAKMISVEDETDLSDLNLGMIATYYYLHYTTVEIFARSLQKKTKLKGLLEILSSATEFDDIPVRPKEDQALRALSRHLPLIVTEGDNFEDPHTKTNICLQTHFSRIPLSNTVARDLTTILPIATRLLQAMVDVLSSNGWLSPALACMEMSQMITQGMWNNESVLLQLPHFTKELAAKCAASGVRTIADLMELEDADRDSLLQFTPQQLVAVAQVCNAYPDIDVTYNIPDATDLHAGSKADIEVRLLRDPDDDDPAPYTGVPNVTSQRYPVTKTEGWWLVLGSLDTNEMVAIKRVAMSQREMKVTMDFTPSKPGKMKYMLYLMSDSYLGCDQEYQVELDVKEGKPESDDDDDAMSDTE